MKKIILFVAIPAFILFLSGCGANDNAATPSIEKLPTPVTSETQEDLTGTSHQEGMELPPLPKDDGEAIDAEIEDIEESMKNLDSEDPSTNSADSELGL